MPEPNEWKTSMGTKKWKVDMKHIRDMLALAASDRYSTREIATSLEVSHQSVTRHLAWIAKAGLGIDRAMELTDEALEAICYPAAPGPRASSKAMPDLAAIIAELAKPNAPTRKVLWKEYREQYQKASYGYSRFAELVRKERSMSTLTMHLEHVPADKLFIDFAGDKVGIYSSPGAKEPDFEASIFVATLAYSQKDLRLGDQVPGRCLGDRCDREGALLLWGRRRPAGSGQHGATCLAALVSSSITWRFLWLLDP